MCLFFLPDIWSLPSVASPVTITAFRGPEGYFKLLEHLSSLSPNAIVAEEEMVIEESKFLTVPSDMFTRQIPQNLKSAMVEMTYTRKSV